MPKAPTAARRSFAVRPFAAVAGLILTAALIPSAAARADEVKLTTLEWPPYSGSLPDDGFSAVVVREAFKAVGHTVVVQVLPWQRAVNTAKEDPAFAGYFPEYDAPVDGFSLSGPIGVSPLGLIAAPGVKPADLTPARLGALKIGVVNGYVNAAPIAAAVAAGTLKPEGAVDDAANIRKVAAGRIDAAEIDRYVFSHLMRNVAELKPLQGKAVFVETLESKTLHVAFADTDQGRKWSAAFAEGLKKIDVQALQGRHLAAAR